MKTLSRKDLKNLTGGVVGDWTTCKSDCGVSEPGCYMFIDYCPGDCTGYGEGNISCSDPASGATVGHSPVKICN